MRAPRLTPPDIPFHVLNRAAGRRQIFLHDNDYAQFEATLEEALTKFRVELAAYCVMPNHYHLLVMPREDGELSRCLCWLQSMHAKRWHAARTGTGGGALYQGRFKSFLVKDDRHLETIWRYVERNPVRAGLVGRAEDWPWGSAWNRVHAPPRAARMLRNGFLEIPGNWLDRVNEPLSADDELAVRSSARRGRPRLRPEKVPGTISVRRRGETAAEMESDTFSGRGSLRGRSR